MTRTLAAPSTLSQGSASVIVAATSSAGSAPAADYIGFTSNLDGGGIRVFFDYTGTVTACVVRLYTRALDGTVWFRGASTADGDALTGTDESQDWDVGEQTEFTFVVESIAGGGTVAVSAMAVAR